MQFFFSLRSIFINIHAICFQIHFIQLICRSLLKVFILLYSFIQLYVFQVRQDECVLTNIALH